MQSIRGFRDIVGDLYDRMDYIKKTAEKAVRAYGYQGIETPILEHTPVFQRSLGETSDVVHKEMYTFLDRNEESLTLRPEGTAGVVRALIENGMTQDLPQKFFYQGPVFRYDRPQKGRYRQFFQFGVECFGIKDPYIDAEIIIMAHRIIETLEIKDSILYINSLGDQASRQSYNQKLVDYLMQFKGDLSEDSQMRLTKHPLRILDSKDLRDREIIKNAPKMIDSLNENSLEFFNNVCALLKTQKIDYVVDTQLVRGLDYYAHTAFEIKHPSLGAQDTFLGGGRFDGLVELMGGPSVPAIGWGMGIDRVAILLENRALQRPSCSVVIPFEQEVLGYALNVAEKLRSKGHNAEISFKGKMAKDLKYAEKKGADIAYLIGSDEMKSQTVTIKYLNDREKKNEVVSLELL